MDDMVAAFVVGDEMNDDGVDVQTWMKRETWNGTMCDV